MIYNGDSFQNTFSAEFNIILVKYLVVLFPLYDTSMVLFQFLPVSSKFNSLDTAKMCSK